tara:strand:- start:10 stop:453 length:444 start_codon:yes stop_codon:yes gene_type:complete
MSDISERIDKLNEDLGPVNLKIRDPTEKPKYGAGSLWLMTKNTARGVFLPGGNDTSNGRDILTYHNPHGNYALTFLNAFAGRHQISLRYAVYINNPATDRSQDEVQIRNLLEDPGDCLIVRDNEVYAEDISPNGITFQLLNRPYLAK